jgi:hypothetical protein
MQSHLIKMREMIGVLLKDWFRYQASFNSEDNIYLQLVNRLERINRGPQNIGYVCLWPHTSKLHAPLVIPNLGKRLLKRSLQNSIFEMKEQRNLEDAIKISVLIGHRGMERLPLLLTTIKSIASQSDVSLECIIIEQDKSPIIKKYLPSWVRHIFLKTDAGTSHYNRSAAFNLGAKNAHGDILLLHDNDMLLPINYCKHIVKLVDEGYEVANTKRYVFYMSRAHTERIMRSVEEIICEAPEYIVQNLEAGGSMAITKEAYFKIGGMDEGFVGWGGEDIEFWKRCSLLKRWIWGFESIIHLWHHSQPLKETRDNPNIERIKTLNNINLRERIALLSASYGRNA